MKIARFALVLAACSGTDTGNPPVIDFGNSGCHDQSYGLNKDAQLQSLDGPLVPDARYKGLTCLVSERVDATHVRIQLTNYETGCGSEYGGWEPHAELREDGGLDLVIEDLNCASARCGLCLYDLAFTVELAQSQPDGEVHVYQRGCDQRDELHAPLALAQADVACRYTTQSALHWKGARDGSERMLCSEVACQPGFVCTDVGDGARCLAACTSGCDDLSECIDGVCKLSATGLTSGPHP